MIVTNQAKNHILQFFQIKTNFWEIAMRISNLFQEFEFSENDYLFFRLLLVKEVDQYLIPN